MNMDREAKEYYEVIIQAKDMGGQLGGLAGTTTVNISLADVNDNPPRFPQSKYLCADLWDATQVKVKYFYNERKIYYYFVMHCILSRKKKSYQHQGAYNLKCYKGDTKWAIDKGNKNLRKTMNSV